MKFMHLGEKRGTSPPILVCESRRRQLLTVVSGFRLDKTKSPLKDFDVKSRRIKTGRTPILRDSDHDFETQKSRSLSYRLSVETLGDDHAHSPTPCTSLKLS
ncbi:hypothetical protein TNCV_4337101 [Trichonephila clavipes]|nr:hypothetical protein TNCV_4337101 [Trichonephila clavipes]